MIVLKLTRRALSQTIRDSVAARGMMHLVISWWGCAILCGTPSADAHEWHNAFERGEPTWKLLHKADRAAIVSHQRVDDLSHDEKGCEVIHIRSSGPTTNVIWEHEIPPATIIDELTASIWVQGSRNGATLWLRVVFPHQIDPKTSRPAEIFLSNKSSNYTSEGSWQKLICATDEKSMQQQIVRLRARLNAENLGDAYVDRMLLTVPMEEGQMMLAVDEARLGPIVPPRSPIPDTQVDDRNSSRHVQLRLGQLMIDGEPFFPIMASYHGEDPDRLRDMGINVAWIPNYQDHELLTRLRRSGLWATAVPPRPLTSDGERLAAHSATLVSFERETEPIAFWMMGTKISISEHRDLKSWVEQVRAADRRIDRPLMADVQDSEYIHSRSIPLLGSSRSIAHTSIPMHTYRRWLEETQLLALPGSFVWTWINTEAAPELLPLAESTNTYAPMIEPEQIRLQVYTALAAGCRGINYWSTSPMDDESDPAKLERRWMLTQINQELQLLEPLLASSSLVAQIPFAVDGEIPPQQVGSKVISFTGRKKYDPNAPVANAEPKKTDALPKRSPQPRAKPETRDADTIYEAALFRSPYGRLILPICYERHAQYVPGAMSVRDVRILVSDFEETASAWEITPTEIRYVHKERKAGGVELRLEKLDTVTAIVLTSDLSMIARLKDQIQQLKDRHAKGAHEVALSKLQRTADVNRALNELGVSQPDSEILLTKARSLLDESARELRRREAASAYRNATDAMQYLRILQRAHWETAVEHWPSPGSNPWTFSFQSLPEHWKLLERIARQQNSPPDNLIPSGNFENFDQMIVAGWRHEQASVEPVISSAELSPLACEGSYSLRLVSMIPPDREVPVVMRSQKILVHSPPVSVRAGELAQISGRMRIRAPARANLDGIMIYDNLLGERGALRWGDDQRPEPSDNQSNPSSSVPSIQRVSHVTHEPADPEGWQRFEMLRDIRRDGELIITFSLSGIGEVLFDDLQVHLHAAEPPRPRVDIPKPESTVPDESNDSSLPGIDFLKKFNVLP